MTDQPPLSPQPDPDTSRPVFAIPENACDSHCHVFSAATAATLQANRAYTPPEAPRSALRKLHDALGIRRAVIVQASAHGHNNENILAAVAEDPANYRAIGAVTEAVTDAELRRLHEGGVRGIRVNLVDKGGMPISSIDAIFGMADRIRDMGWHVELLIHVEEHPDFKRLVTGLKVPVSVGHIGYTKVKKGLDDPGYREFLAILRDGFGWVKLSGPFRISSEEALPYSDTAPFAAAVVAAAPDRVLWGSDWPHVMQRGPMPNDGKLLDLLQDWVPDAAQRTRILVDNPARLYGF
jgi:predicted TIM-barrel fold metal-dependent hydrolase